MYEHHGSFRPLTGIMVLIDGYFDWLEWLNMEEFPSPYGDYGSYPQWLTYPTE